MSTYLFSSADISLSINSMYFFIKILTSPGIDIDFNDGQHLKAFLLISITLSGITTFSNDEQQSNTLSPIVFTLPGIFISFNDEQL